MALDLLSLFLSLPPSPDFIRCRGYAPVKLKAGIVIVQPFRSLANIVFSPVGDAWESFSNGDELERENTLLSDN